MKMLRSLLVLALVLFGGPVLAQVTPGTSPLSIAKGGTGAATASAARTSLGVPTGTSGAVLGFLNTANTWSALQTFGAASATSLASGPVTITSNSASALAVGRLGATTPAFQVDSSVASSITGIKVTS